MPLSILRNILFVVLACCLLSNGAEAKPLVLETTRAYSTSIESPLPAPIYISQDSHRSAFFGMLKRLLERVQSLYRPKPSEQPSPPVATAPAPTPVTPDPTPPPTPSTPPPPPTAPAPDPPAAPVPPVTTNSSGILTFIGVEGEPNPTPQTLDITNTAGGTVSWTANDNASWLTLSPTSGTTTTETDLITVSVDVTGLTTNTYTGIITLSTLGTAATPEQIPVTLILSPASPTIGASPTTLVFPGIEGGSNPTSQKLEIENIGKGTLNWSVSESAPWLTLSTTAGTTTTETDRITVNVNAAGMKASSYTTTITVTDPAASNSPHDIPVTLVLTAPQSGMAELTWIPNTESDLAGYKVYIGTTTGNYLPSVDVGNTTTHKVTGLLPGQTYYFAVTAYNKSGNESGYSNEASKSMP